MMAESKRRTEVRLTDGTSTFVDERAEWAVKQLMHLIDLVALGKTQSFALVEVRQGATPLTVMFTKDGERLDELGAKLAEVSTKVHRLGSIWDGNAPSTNRSSKTN